MTKQIILLWLRTNGDWDCDEGVKRFVHVTVCDTWPCMTRDHVCLKMKTKHYYTCGAWTKIPHYNMQACDNDENNRLCVFRKYPGRLLHTQQPLLKTGQLTVSKSCVELLNSEHAKKNCVVNALQRWPIFLGFNQPNVTCLHKTKRM